MKYALGFVCGLNNAGVLNHLDGRGAEQLVSSLWRWRLVGVMSSGGCHSNSVSLSLFPARLNGLAGEKGSWLHVCIGHSLYEARDRNKALMCSHILASNTFNILHATQAKSPFAVF